MLCFVSGKNKMASFVALVVNMMGYISSIRDQCLNKTSKFYFI